MVSAWANDVGLSLGQVKVKEKSNEITAIPELLNILCVFRCICATHFGDVVPLKKE